MALNLDKSSSMKIVVNCQANNHITDSQPVISSLPFGAIMYTKVNILLAIKLEMH